MKSSDYLLAMKNKSFGTHSMDGAVALADRPSAKLAVAPPRAYLSRVTSLSLTPSAAKRVAFIAASKASPPCFASRSMAAVARVSPTGSRWARSR